MSVSKRVPPESAIRGAQSPFGLPTTIGDVSVTTSSALLFADASVADGFGIRRVRIYNADASATLGIFFIAAAGTATGLTIGNALKIGPGQTESFTIKSNVRIAAVGSASLTANVFVEDLK
jgi:hypothetical protein